MSGWKSESETNKFKVSFRMKHLKRNPDRSFLIMIAILMTFWNLVSSGMWSIQRAVTATEKDTIDFRHNERETGKYKRREKNYQANYSDGPVHLSPSFEGRLGLRVECLLKIHSGCHKNAGVGTPWQTLGIPLFSNQQGF